MAVQPPSSFGIRPLDRLCGSVQPCRNNQDFRVRRYHVSLDSQVQANESVGGALGVTGNTTINGQTIAAGDLVSTFGNGSLTFTPGTGVTSVACVSGHTCNNVRGTLQIVNSSAQRPRKRWPPSASRRLWRTFLSAPCHKPRINVLWAVSRHGNHRALPGRQHQHRVGVRHHLSYVRLY